MTNTTAPLILAIDLGTSGPKVALATAQGQIIAAEIGQTEVILLPGGGAEQDPDAWWRAITACVKRLVSISPSPCATPNPASPSGSLTICRRPSLPSKPIPQ
ncbi:MAG TPA: hypothetical protein EYH05_03965 [Anaerolineae bacterium]|nr:hypothetical protein [Anaerolineae bacterium]